MKKGFHNWISDPKSHKNCVSEYWNWNGFLNKVKDMIHDNGLAYRELVGICCQSVWTNLLCPLLWQTLFESKDYRILSLKWIHWRKAFRALIDSKIFAWNVSKCEMPYTWVGSDQSYSIVKHWLLSVSLMHFLIPKQFV